MASPVACKLKRRRGRPRKIIGWPSLCALMDAAGYDDKRLGEEMGVSRAAVGYWRRGKYVPLDAAFPLLASILAGDENTLRADAPRKKGRNLYGKTVQNTVNQV